MWLQRQEVECRRMNPAEPARLDLKDLDALLAQAKAERWTKLALLAGILAEHFAATIRSGWPAAQVVILSTPLQQVPEALSHIDGLTSLDLMGNQIGDAGAEALARLSGLTSLDLMGNQIGDAGAEALARLSGLTSLHLGANQIGDAGAEALARLSGLTSLNLWGNQIGDAGAEALSRLGGLTSLKLMGNQVGDAGAEALSRLSGLTSLHLMDNQIGDAGAEALSRLSGLTSLDLRGNQIGDAGAEALARLSGLTSLDLRANEIGDAGAEALSRLGGLTLLQLGANRIGDGGAEALSRLGGLTELDLWGNQIGIPGARAILNAWADPPTSDKRQRLSLGENASTTGLLPAEVLKQTDAQALIAAWRSFREAEAAGTLRPLNEAKLLVVGNEAVGKTSLVRYLIDNRPRDPDEKKTPGVAMRERIATETWAPRGGDVRLNVWDFGGQEIMRGTHRYFLTKRSLYLLVLEDRREDDRSVYDWLKIIKSRGEESPVLVVINKCDEGEPKLRLDVTALRRDYPAVVEVVAVSCNAGSDERIAGLRALIARTIADDARLRHVRDPFPAEQLRVKEAVAAAARNASVLEHRAFVRLCEEVDDPALRVLDPNLQRSLLQLLHDLGTVVAHGLERNLAALREVTLLDPNWLTDAIYALLNSRQILDQGGEFGFTDMAALLDPARFPPERFEYIVEMMQEEEIGLCFRLPGGGEPRWLMPEALPTSAPDYGGLLQGCAALSLHLCGAAARPRCRASSSQAHDKLTNEPTRWRTGVVLAAADCKVLVRADRDRERVDIAVTGPGGAAALGVAGGARGSGGRAQAQSRDRDRGPGAAAGRSGGRCQPRSSAGAGGRRAGGGGLQLSAGEGEAEVHGG
jgi:internalin A